SLLPGGVCYGFGTLFQIPVSRAQRLSESDQGEGPSGLLFLEIFIRFFSLHDSFLCLLTPNVLLISVCLQLTASQSQALHVAALPRCTASDGTLHSCRRDPQPQQARACGKSLLAHSSGTRPVYRHCHLRCPG